MVATRFEVTSLFFAIVRSFPMGRGLLGHREYSTHGRQLSGYLFGLNPLTDIGFDA
jgi:hypothetical protein